MKIIKIKIRSFRSIIDMEVPFIGGKMMVLCGANNVG